MKKDKSKHHLFTYYEVRKKLIQIFGEPITDEEHIFIQTEIKRVRKMMPLYEIDHNKHMELHKNDKKLDEKDIIELMIWAENNGRDYIGTDKKGRTLQFKKKIQSLKTACECGGAFGGIYDGVKRCDKCAKIAVVRRSFNYITISAHNDDLYEYGKWAYNQLIELGKQGFEIIKVQEMHDCGSCVLLKKELSQ